MTVDEIITKLSPTRARALHTIHEGLHHQVHLREIGGLEAWGLIDTSHVHGTRRPTSAWLTDLGHAVLDRLEEE